MVESAPAAAGAIRSEHAAGGLSARDKAAYASGDMVDGIANFGVGTFIFYYLTAVCGLSGSIAGALLAISLTVDAFADPLIGSMSDNARSRIGRRLPFMFGSAVPLALSFALVFSIPPAASGWALVGLAGALLLALRVLMSMFTLPYGALGAELATDYRERSVLVIYRWFFNCLGNLVVIVLGLWVFMRGAEGLLDRRAYAGFGWSCAAVVAVAALTSSWGAWRMPQHRRDVAGSGRVDPAALLSELREVFSNRSFVLLFASTLLFWTGQGVIATLGLHANLYFWKLPSQVIATLPLVGLAGFGLGIPVAAWALRTYEKRDVAIAGLLVGGASQFALAPLRLMGVIPADGMPLYLLLGSVLFFGSVAGTLAIVSWVSMMADAAEEHELLFGSRREGLYFAGLTLSGKAAGGLGGLLGGLALDAIGFPRDVAAIGAAGIAQDTAARLGLVHGPLGALIALAAAGVLMMYRLDQNATARLQAELARRGGREGETA